MVLFLIPVAVVGYKVWDNHQKKKQAEEAAQQQQGEEEETTGEEPARVVDTIPCDDTTTTRRDHLQKGHVSDETVEITSLTTTENIDSFASTDEDDDQTRSTLGNNDEAHGPLAGFCRFLEDKLDKRRARELQKQKNRELARQIASGSMALPKISFK